MHQPPATAVVQPRRVVPSPAGWLREHGVDPADWDAVSPIRNASRRVHAEVVGDLPALDRARLRALEGRRSADPVSGVALDVAEQVREKMAR
jgi:hypothetical protein